jgi:aspartyl-tRNA(Asn)/glutamyl-tRNA(Gln) amidotransferase subunit A
MTIPDGAADIAAAVGAGRLDPLDVTDFFLDRIARDNGRLNAIVDHDPSPARAEAMALRARIAAGEALPLAGVPVVVKDSIWVAGRRITQGSLLFRDFRPPVDALPVERLRAAGAVVIGIGNCSEFGCKSITTNKVYGHTGHPMDPRLTPGGSSGGCASAVAAGFAPLSLGGDGGGSARRPPAHVGAVGFKPSNGTVADPFGFPGIMPGIAVTCPIGRDVADTALLFEAIARPDPRDPASVALPVRTIPDIAGLRIAYSPHFGLDAVMDDDVAAATEQAVARLQAAGLRIERADPVWPEGTSEASITAIEYSGLAALLGERWRAEPELFDPDVAWQIERGLALSGTDVARAWAASGAIAAAVARFFGSFDLLIGPTTPCVAWPGDRQDPETLGGRPAAHRGHAVFTPMFNHALTPAISIPCGTGRDGLPVGLQIVGPRFSDRIVLAAASFMEAALRRA